MWIRNIKFTKLTNSIVKVTIRVTQLFILTSFKSTVKLQRLYMNSSDESKSSTNRLPMSSLLKLFLAFLATNSFSNMIKAVPVRWPLDLSIIMFSSEMEAELLKKSMTPGIETLNGRPFMSKHLSWLCGPTFEPIVKLQTFCLNSSDESNNSTYRLPKFYLLNVFLAWWAINSFSNMTRADPVL